MLVSLAKYPLINVRVGGNRHNFKGFLYIVTQVTIVPIIVNVGALK